MEEQVDTPRHQKEFIEDVKKHVSSCAFVDKIIYQPQRPYVDFTKKPDPKAYYVKQKNNILRLIQTGIKSILCTLDL